MTPAAALAYLQSLRQFGFQPGLGTTRRLAALAGDPQDHLRFIHVAGTNGKGSTCALLESVYRAAGYRTGLYTSPHLVRFGERIQVGRQFIPDADLARLVAQVADLVARAPGGLETTFFEFTTVVALLWFAEQRCDVVIWETGLGGRLDATNIVTPLASVLTSIGLDHQHVLGNTLGAIAREKAGIIKPGVPVLSAVAVPEAAEVIAARARELDAPLVTVGPAARRALDARIPLPGAHQISNAALAAATVRALRCVLPVDDHQLRAGLESVRWPGRFQVVERGAQTVVLDGAHNPEGVAALRATLDEYFPGRNPTLVLGILADKDWTAMVHTLAACAGTIITTPVASPRTVSADELRAACLTGRPPGDVHAARSVPDALARVAGDPLVLITGSLYLIGEALEALGLADPPDAGERGLNEWGGGIRR